MYFSGKIFSNDTGKTSESKKIPQYPYSGYCLYVHMLLLCSIFNSLGLGHLFVITNRRKCDRLLPRKNSKADKRTGKGAVVCRLDPKLFFLNEW